MSYIIVTLLGFVAGGITTFVVVSGRWTRAQTVLTENAERQQELTELEARLHSERTAFTREMKEQSQRLKADRAEFDARTVSYDERRNENMILKRDLRNIDVAVSKAQLDRELQRQTQETLDERSKELASRFLKDNVKWIASILTPSNFVACKQRLLNVIAWCREIAFEISAEQEAAFVADLKQEFEKIVRAAFEREEQARIKARMREDQLLKREIDRELKQLDRERLAIQAALDKALAEAKDQHSAQIVELRARLAEAEAKSQKAISQAQLTKAGNVYVISNLGSFGADVFKIGMTRRLEPLERVRELGDASVPFPFDVHAMIACDDAPTLENALHRKLHKRRMNKINPRKEFFKTNFESILEVVREHHGEIQYAADPEALEYRQSLDISDEDQEFIKAVFDRVEDEEDSPAGLDPNLHD